MVDQNELDNIFGRRKYSLSTTEKTEAREEDISQALEDEGLYQIEGGRSEPAEYDTIDLEDPNDCYEPSKRYDSSLSSRVVGELEEAQPEDIERSLESVNL